MAFYAGQLPGPIEGFGVQSGTKKLWEKKLTTNWKEVQKNTEKIRKTKKNNKIQKS